jgi:hypothetical protein
MTVKMSVCFRAVMLCGLAGGKNVSKKHAVVIIRAGLTVLKDATKTRVDPIRFSHGRCKPTHGILNE